MNLPPSLWGLAALRVMLGALGLLALALVAASGESTQAFPRYISKSWHKEDGLPHEAVEAVVQTSDGYLWLGTQRGLARFNGVEFKVFDAENTPALKSSHIAGLWADKTGALWVASARGGLTRYQDGKFERFEVETGPEAALVKGLVEGPEGVLWVGTGGSWYAWEKGKVRRLLERPSQSLGYLRAMCSDQKDGFWFGTASSGVFHVRAGQVIASYSITNGLPHNSVRSLCLARSGTLWVGTMLGVMSGLHPDGTSTYYGPTNGLSGRIVTALYEDRQGLLWIGTQAGLHYVAKGRLYREMQENGAAYNSVSALTEDAEGNVWVGTNEGVFRLRPRMFSVYTTQQGLPHNNVTAVFEDKAGAVWFATWGGGVCKLENEQTTVLTRRDGLTRDLILCLCQDRAGTMWAGSDLGGGLMHLVPDAPRSPRANRNVPGTVRFLYEDRQTNLWIGTAAGLYRWQQQTSVRYTVREGLANDMVRAICEDHVGNLWVGTARGLSCFTKGNFRSFAGQDELTNHTVSALLEDSAHNLWLGTDRGLVRMREGKLRRYTTRQGLAEDEVFSVLEDERGSLWMSSPNGVFSVARTSFEALDAGTASALRCISYDKHDGLATTQCSGVGQPSAWKGHDGRLWFPTMHGAAVIAPGACIKPNDRVPPVFIEEVFMDKARASDRASRAVSFPLAHPQAALVFAPGRGELEFHYASLSFQAPEKNRFRYQLEGVDPEWVEAGARRVAYYNNVAPGSYRFRVQASNNDGVWNEAGASVGLMLSPHSWQTWWFRVLLGIGFVGMVAATARYFEQRKARRQMQRLEIERAREQERARIARDIHDDLGARLTKISKLSEQVRRLSPAESPASVSVSDIQGTAQEMLSRLDETVWAINPRNDRLDSLAEYLLSYAEEFFRNTSMRCRFKVVGEIPSLAIAAEPRHHLFLAVKEALNNAARHSGATEVQLQIEFTGGLFQVLVQDNGRGFQAAEALTLHRGLENMRSRLELLRGRLELQTQPGQGAAIRMEFNPAECTRAEQLP